MIRRGLYHVLASMAYVSLYLAIKVQPKSMAKMTLAGKDDAYNFEPGMMVVPIDDGNLVEPDRSLN